MKLGVTDDATMQMIHDPIMLKSIEDDNFSQLIDMYGYANEEVIRKSLREIFLTIKNMDVMVPSRAVVLSFFEHVQKLLHSGLYTRAVSDCRDISKSLSI